MIRHFHPFVVYIIYFLTYLIEIKCLDLKCQHCTEDKGKTVKSEEWGFESRYVSANRVLFLIIVTVILVVLICTLCILCKRCPIRWMYLERRAQREALRQA